MLKQTHSQEFWTLLEPDFGLGTLNGLPEHSLDSWQSEKFPPTFSPLLPHLGSDLHFDLTDLLYFLTSFSFFPTGISSNKILAHFIPSCHLLLGDAQTNTS